MIGLCFHFDEWHRDVWSGRPVDLDAYRYTAKAFGVDRVAVVNAFGAEIAWCDESLLCDEFETLEQFEQSEAGGRVYVETPWDCPAGATPLDSFEHPESAWYVFGSVDGLPHRSGEWVFIPQDGRGALHATHATAVVMAHRYLTR